jgi:hypothetical protein
LVKSGQLAVVGVAQEQHPERCVLFARWKGIDWPILWDPFNITGTRAVLRLAFIDEHGIVREVEPTEEGLAAFVATRFDAPPTAQEVPRDAEPQLVEALRAKPDSPEAAWYGALSDLLWNTGNGDRAMQALTSYGASHPKDAAVRWRLGVAYRMRYDSAERHDGDFEAAVSHWRAALAIDPGQYIYRRRLEQYGPRLEQPYPFYSWVADARRGLRDRGEQPPELRAPLSGTERAAPAASAPAAEPDPGRKIESAGDLLDVEHTVVWAAGSPQGSASARVHVTLRPSGRAVMLWEAEAGPVTIWLNLPPGWRTDTPRIEHTLRGEDKAGEEVALDFELNFSDGEPAAGRMKAYALFHACRDISGQCSYLRHDFEIDVRPPR